MIFGVLLVDTFRKFRKNLGFWGKIHLPTSKNFEIHLPRWGAPLPSNPDYNTFSAIRTRTQLYWDLPQKDVKFGEACPKLEIWQFVEILYECGTHPTKNKNQGSFSETVIYLAVWYPY